MFAETNDPGGQHYDGCTLSRTNGLEMRSPGAPSAALQTGGTTAKNAKFIQKFGYWEARFKVPHNTHGEGSPRRKSWENKAKEIVSPVGATEFVPPLRGFG
ncbi:MAG: hypothetical protein ABSH20_13335 [Tepidisphaeraceae bacterium]|jgi:hypothetical protein